MKLIIQSILKSYGLRLEGDCKLVIIHHLSQDKYEVLQAEEEAQVRALEIYIAEGLCNILTFQRLKMFQQKNVL